MTPDPDINSCMAVLGQIKDPKVRYYWLKLGQSLATVTAAPKPVRPKAKAKRKTVS